METSSFHPTSLFCEHRTPINGERDLRNFNFVLPPYSCSIVEECLIEKTWAKVNKAESAHKTAKTCLSNNGRNIPRKNKKYTEWWPVGWFEIPKNGFLPKFKWIPWMLTKISTFVYSNIVFCEKPHWKMQKHEFNKLPIKNNI